MMLKLLFFIVSNKYAFMDHFGRLRYSVQANVDILAINIFPQPWTKAGQCGVPPWRLTKGPVRRPLVVEVVIWGVHHKGEDLQLPRHLLLGSEHVGGRMESLIRRWTLLGRQQPADHCTLLCKLVDQEPAKLGVVDVPVLQVGHRHNIANLEVVPLKEDFPCRHSCRLHLRCFHRFLLGKTSTTFPSRRPRYFPTSTFGLTKRPTILVLPSTTFLCWSLLCLLPPQLPRSRIGIGSGCRAGVRSSVSSILRVSPAHTCIVPN